MIGKRLLSETTTILKSNYLTESKKFKVDEYSVKITKETGNSVKGVISFNVEKFLKDNIKDGKVRTILKDMDFFFGLKEKEIPFEYKNGKLYIDFNGVEITRDFEDNCKSIEKEYDEETIKKACKEFKELIFTKLYKDLKEKVAPAILKELKKDENAEVIVESVDIEEGKKQIRVSLKSESINESVNIQGTEDLKELYPDLYELVKDFISEKEYSVSFQKRTDSNKGIISLNPYSIAKREDKLGVIDVGKLDDIVKQLIGKDKVLDVYLDDRGLVIEVEL